MLGVNYESSDEEEVLPATSLKVSPAHVHLRTPIATNIELANVPVAAAPAPTPESISQPPPRQVTPPSTAPVSGPAQGPTVSPPPPDDNADNAGAPGSPYTSSRAIIQNLTLPTVPNFAIPPSPPGSPPQRATKKFAQFLELKKKGQHFNQRLESSSVLRDPNHSQKLMDFAGIREEDQYTSTLPEGLAVPAVFPPWAYVEELRASQKKILATKEHEKARTPREAIDFVSASRSGTASRTSTPSGRTSTSQIAGKRKELEHRSREVSPKRRR
ncbi:Meiotically up-regulated gene 151 protein [Stagonosporopsis vannaccii]|nr:Meiotically up-regulated gene 151 protein [Stagonosporopsis vannaccii]